jgi:hypothetical protein
MPGLIILKNLRPLSSLKMKKILLSAAVAMLFVISVSAQHAIRANHVINHIGENVVVVDSIYSVKMFNDSTAVISLGSKSDMLPLNVVFNLGPKSTFNPDILKSCCSSIVEVTGLVSLQPDQLSIVVTDKKNLYFYSNNINQSWLELSQLSYKKH